MTRSKPYSMVDVKSVRLEPILAGRPRQTVHVGSDVSKEWLAVALCWGKDQFERPWRVCYPEDLGVLMEVLKELAGKHEVIVALEPTGTYGEPLRWALAKAGIPTHRVESKVAHDHAESFDRVPSQHDAKDALVIAELAMQGKSRPWAMERSGERESQMRSLVAAAGDQQQVLGVWTNRLEALLARHWPEATRVLELGSVTLLEALVEYGTPAGLAEDAEAAVKLRRWGGHLLSEQTITELLDRARTTAGVPASEAEAERLRHGAQQALAATRQLEKAKRQLEKLAEGDAELSRMAEVVGRATACVLFVLLGSPRNYACVRAYLKAAGLNLAERSSGQYQGQLKISKRGPAIARKWLYLAAARLLKHPLAAAWLQRKKDRDRPRTRGLQGKGVGLIGMVALMRKLLGAVWAVSNQDEPFVVQRLFGGGPPRRSGSSRQPAVACR